SDLFVTDDWIDEAGRRVKGESRVNDTGLRFTVSLADASTRVVAELREKGDTFRLTLGGGAALALERLAGPRPVPLDAGAPVELPVGRPVAVSFRNVDDRLRVRIDGELVVDVPYERNTEVSGLASRNEPSLAVVSGRARLRGLTVTRDVFYTENGCDHAVRAPFAIPAGEAFLLGDNSVNSRDSRHFGSVPLDRFVGRPFLIFRPLGRWRFL
ncbi:MAG: S26 family signal peptidase, partial [Planctomycetota bacterium JB042]